MNGLVPRNRVRFEEYYVLFRNFLENRLLQSHDIEKFHGLLATLQFEECSFALVQAIHHFLAKGSPVRTTLSAEFYDHMVLTLITAYGTDEREELNSLTLLTLDRFFATATQALLTLFEDDALETTLLFDNCFETLLMLLNATKHWSLIPYLADSTAIHAFLVANDREHARHMLNGLIDIGANPAKPDVHHQKPITPAHRRLVENVALTILREPSRSVDCWKRAFGFFAGAASWRSFALRCRWNAPSNKTKHNARLETLVQHGFEQPPQPVTRCSSPKKRKLANVVATTVLKHKETLRNAKRQNAMTLLEQVLK